MRKIIKSGLSLLLATVAALPGVALAQASAVLNGVTATSGIAAAAAAAAIAQREAAAVAANQFGALPRWQDYLNKYDGRTFYFVRATQFQYQNGRGNGGCLQELAGSGKSVDTCKPMVVVSSPFFTDWNSAASFYNWNSLNILRTNGRVAMPAESSMYKVSFRRTGATYTRYGSAAAMGLRFGAGSDLPPQCRTNYEDFRTWRPQATDPDPAGACAKDLKGDFDGLQMSFEDQNLTANQPVRRLDMRDLDAIFAGSRITELDLPVVGACGRVTGASSGDPSYHTCDFMPVGMRVLGRSGGRTGLDAYVYLPALFFESSDHWNRIPYP